jgi:sulfhydrogenase subunit gamma (sulfur reductase)
MLDQPQTLLIKHVQQQAPEIRSFDMMPEGAAGAHGVLFIPGQVAVLRVGDEQAYFAFASAPEDTELEFLVKRGFGAGGVIYEMKENGRVELGDVVGHGFALSEQKDKDLVFVAMGTGVAPLRSALRHVVKHKSEFGQLVVLYGARTPGDFCYSDEVDEWEAAGVELRRVISRPDGHDWSGPTGYVQSLLDHVLPDLSAPVALICGSREMIGQTRQRLEQMGFPPEAILTNY